MKFARVLAVAAVAALTCSSPALAVFDLQLTEVYEGVSGDDITEDWVEITNFGDMAYTFGVDGQLYYDDSSADPTEDEQVTGITDIQPGESVVVVLGNAASDVTDFVNAWGAANLVGVEIGFLIGDDPGGLSQGGESLFFFDDNTALAAPTPGSTTAAQSRAAPGPVSATWSINRSTASMVRSPPPSAQATLARFRWSAAPAPIFPSRVRSPSWCSVLLVWLASQCVVVASTTIARLE